MKHARSAFTLIEVLVSVLILSTSIFYVMKIYSQNHEQILYVSKRNVEALEDSLFLTDRTLHYDKESKNAYDLLHYFFKNIDNKSRKILKKTERSIRLSEPLRLIEPENGRAPSAKVTKIILKDSFSSSYHQFSVKSF